MHIYKADLIYKSIKADNACDPVFPVCTLSQIPQDTVLEIWKGEHYQAELSKMTKAGHRVLLSAPWYINHISYGQDWRISYAVQPQNFSGVCSSMLGWGQNFNILYKIEKQMGN